MIAAEFGSEAGTFERIIARVNAERLSEIHQKTAILSTLWDAWKCPEAELPMLAWALSVDFWDDHWPLHRKRQVVAESLLFHHRKTTPAGVRMALSYRDAQLVNYNLPRHGLFVDKAATAGDDAKWADNLPEIRIYDPAPFVLQGAVHRYAGINLFARGVARLSRKAVLVSNGHETALAIRPSGAMEKITFPAQKRTMMIAGRGLKLRITGPAKLSDRALAIHPVTSDASYVRIAASAGDIGTFISVSKHLKIGFKTVFTPAGKGGLRYAAPVGIAHKYLALKYSSQSGRLTGHRPRNVVGKSRVTRRPFSAAWTVGWSRPIPRSRLQQGRRVSPSSTARVAGFMEAIQSASALRDQNFISLNATRRLTFADCRKLQAGMKFGDRRSNAYV